MRKNKNQAGFSLIELLMVVVIVGLLATIAVPSLLRSRESADKASTIATLRMINMHQSGQFFRKGRFGTLSEINQATENTLGTTTGNALSRNGYVFYQFPDLPSRISTEYTVYALKFEGGFIISGFVMNQTGEIRTLAD